VVSLGRALLRPLGVALGLGLLALAAPALAADDGGRASSRAAVRAADLPNVTRGDLERCARLVAACDSPRVDRLLRAHRRRDVGVALFLAGHALGGAGVGLAALTINFRAGIAGNLPWVAPLGVGAAMVVVSPFLVGAAVGGARPFLLLEDRKVGTVLLTTAFVTYVSAAAFAFSAPRLGAGAILIGGGLYLLGTGLLWAAANDALAKARPTARPELTIAPELLRGGGGLTVVGSFGRR